MKHLFAALALATMIPGAASAATVILVGDLVSGDANLLPGFGTTSFEFEAGERMKIPQVAFTLNGFSAADVGAVHFGLNVSDKAAAVTGGPSVFTGGKTVDYYAVFDAGDTFTIAFSESAPLTALVNGDFTFVSSEVPVPAAGLLLGSLLLGGGAIARRKSRG